ncbi:hypothetical protein YC2023_082060 [Brassica napus]
MGDLSGSNSHIMRVKAKYGKMSCDDCRLTPFDLTKKKKKKFVVQDAIEDSAESHGRHTIRCLIRVFAEHPNDEEEVEGIDLHQQSYPWEGSDMDYLYDEQSSFAQLLSMELTVEIDGAIFHVPNANASSNASGDVTLGAWFIGLGYTKSVVTLKLLPHLTLILVLGRIADCE